MQGCGPDARDWLRFSQCDIPEVRAVVGSPAAPLCAVRGEPGQSLSQEVDQTLMWARTPNDVRAGGQIGMLGSPCSRVDRGGPQRHFITSCVPFSLSLPFSFMNTSRL